MLTFLLGAHPGIGLLGHGALWAFSSVSGKIAILFPDLRDGYLGLEGEFTDHRVTVEMPEAGVSAQGPLRLQMNGLLSRSHEPSRVNVKIETRFGVSGERIKKMRGYGQWAAFSGQGQS